MDDKDLESKQELVKIVEELIEEGRWRGTPFLEITGKRLQDLRRDLCQEFGFHLDADAKAPAATPSSTIPAPASERVDVYLSLYQADGLNLRKWEALLNSVASYSLGRSIYEREEDLAAWLRSKENKKNEAYVAISVHKNDILPPAHGPLLDRFNHTLLTVREGALQPKNISRFVHVTGEFSFNKGTLSKKSF